VFFVWGEAGAGKSHLLQACPAAYCDARLDPQLSALAPAQDVYAVDHLEALVDGGQIVLFNLINRLRAGGGRLLAAADLPPSRLTLREDLRTRLGSGLVYRLQPLSDAEKLAALAEQARTSGPGPAAGGLQLPLFACTTRHAQPGCLAPGHRPLLARTQASDHPAAAARGSADLPEHLRPA
jgi:hypothetical protein